MRTLALTVSAVAVLLAGLPMQSAYAECTARDCPTHITVSGAPGPIAGAGLPILAVIGGAYYLVRRQRRNKR